MAYLDFFLFFFPWKFGFSASAYLSVDRWVSVGPAMVCLGRQVRFSEKPFLPIGRTHCCSCRARGLIVSMEVQCAYGSISRIPMLVLSRRIFDSPGRLLLISWSTTPQPMPCKLRGGSSLQSFVSP